MKLYYSPLACSLAAHIACREAGLDFELVRVDLPTKQTASGADLFAENPMGQVPTLVLPNGRILTENVAVLSYLSDRAPKAASGMERDPLGDGYELIRWLSFVATEIHKKVLWPIYSPTTPDAVKAHARESAGHGLGVLSARLESRDALLGATFTAADAYLFWTLILLPHAGVPLDDFPALVRYRKLHKTRPSVHDAVAYEKQQYETPFAAA